MLKNNFSKIVAAFAVMAMMAPGLALANGSGHNDDDNKGRFEANASPTNEFGVHILGERNRRGNDDNNKDKNKNEARRGNKDDRKDFAKQDFGKGIFPHLFYSGEVTATSSTGFTFLINSGVSLTVNTGSAKLVRIPHDVIANSDIAVGDRVHISGTKADGVVTASVVYVMPHNLKPAIAKGTVTAVTDDSITVQTKDDQTITVNTNSDTQVTDQNGDEVAITEIDSGAKVKLFGLWDTVLNVFNAIKIRLK